jgi:PRC-barrel domain
MPHKPHRLIASDRVEGTVVRRSDGTKVGTIQRLMIDKVSGKIAYAVLSFGSFMGIGAKHIPVPWDRMKYSASLDAYEINVTNEELARAPSYEADKEFDWGNREDEIMIHNYYRTPPYWGV